MAPVARLATARLGKGQTLTTRAFSLFQAIQPELEPPKSATGSEMSLPALGYIRIGIIGLGYVGLPLAVYLARHLPVQLLQLE